MLGEDGNFMREVVKIINPTRHQIPTRTPPYLLTTSYMVLINLVGCSTLGPEN